MSRIRAVIWDFGGVITNSPFEAFNRFEEAHGLPPDFLRQVNAQNHHTNAWARFERSELDLAGFDAAFRLESAALGYPVNGRDVIALLGGQIRPSMVNALRRLRPHMLLGLITNNVQAGETPGVDATGRQAVLALFHAVIESAKVGLRKPDPAIYQLMCDTLNIAPDEAVFLDDLGINLKPARALGMRTIKVEEPDLALAALEQHVGIALRS